MITCPTHKTNIDPQTVNYFTIPTFSIQFFFQATLPLYLDLILSIEENGHNQFIYPKSGSFYLTILARAGQLVDWPFLSTLSKHHRTVQNQSGNDLFFLFEPMQTNNKLCQSLVAVAVVCQFLLVNAIACISFFSLNFVVPTLGHKLFPCLAPNKQAVAVVVIVVADYQMPSQISRGRSHFLSL